VALSAFVGAAGLMTGFMDPGTTIDARLPFASSAFGGIALAVVVGVPMTVAAIDAWRSNPQMDTMAIGAGMLLVGWIVVEMAVIRSFSWLQPALLSVGVAIAAAGYRGRQK